MKKRLFSILGILLAIFSFTNVFALSKSDMTTLKLKSIKKLTNPRGFSSVQGGTTTDKYIVSLFRNSTDTKTAIVVLNKNNYKKTKLGGTNYKLGHGNSATYNNKTNEVLTIDKNIVHVLSATTFKEKKKIKLDKTYHAIGYDSKTNQYVLAASSGNKTIFHIMDVNFKEKSKFSIVVNMTRQSLTVKNGVIYYCTYESGKKTKYQKQYDGVLKSKENAIYVYDLNGNKKTIYYIPKTYNNESFNEIENVSFDGDKIIVQFNQHGKAGYYTSISKLKNYTLTGNSKNNSSNTKNNTNNVNSNSSSNSTNKSDSSNNNSNNTNKDNSSNNNSNNTNKDNSSNNNLSNINNKNETNNNMNSSNNETNSSNNTFNINNTNTSNKDSNTSSNGLKDTQNTNTSNTNKTSNNSISNNTKRSTANNISNVDNSRSSTKIVKVPNTDTNSYIEIIGLFIIVGALLFIVKLKIFYEK
ncbi:MAG: hypothetical protein SPJ74_00645 [Bacilli bacterium]|nr:hypothetical protein [Bacilli bacterium]